MVYTAISQSLMDFDSSRARLSTVLGAVLLVGFQPQSRRKRWKTAKEENNLF